MELTKLPVDELRRYDEARLRETEKEIRKNLLGVRMDIFTAPTAHTGKVRNLKKTLARLLTVRVELQRKQKSV